MGLIGSALTYWRLVVQVAGRDASTFLANASEGIDLGELEVCTCI